jgi:hypothetical protein
MVAAIPLTNEFGARAAWVVTAGLYAAGAATSVGLLRRSQAAERARGAAVAGQV